MKNSKLYKQVISDENIYKAIYSLESYVFEKELLNNEDNILFNKLCDKYNTNLIEEVIQRCKKKINEVILGDKTFDCTVFFMPKKLENDILEYRPLHTTDLISQICIVAILNLIMFNDTRNTRRLSDLSKLMPSNFYGNIPSTKVDILFEPWNFKYQQYSDNIINATQEYYKSKKYEHEINLDLAKFYPSIDPRYIYNFIIKRLSISFSPEDSKCYKKLLEKLLFLKVNLNKEELSLYYPTDLIRSNLKYRFVVGIPQGLPQAYYFGNLAMIEIAAILNKNLKDHDSYFYVDDSVILTTLEEKNNFTTWIQKLNKELEICFSPNYDFSINEEIDLFNNSLNYKVRFHEDGKSYISDIHPPDLLYDLAKPASTLSFQIRAAFDEIEDESLRKKIEAILENIDNRLKDDYRNQKLLLRYRKFYTYRLKLLNVRHNNEVSKSQVNDFLEKFGLNADEDKSIFFDKLKDDIFKFEGLQLVQRLRIDVVSQEKLIKAIKKFEYSLNPKITNHYFSRIFENSLFLANNHNDIYTSLTVHIENTIEPFYKVKQQKKIEAMESIKSILNCSTYDSSFFHKISNFLEKYEKGFYSSIFSLSPQFKRRLINAIFSRIFNVKLNDECCFQKSDNRSILYYELRILMFLRNYDFENVEFVKFLGNILLELRENAGKIDMALFEVLPVFKKYIRNTKYVDELILAHKYVNGIWKNGSKFLHFYTLHNEEHSIELIKNCVKITTSIDYLSVKKYDYYILFLCCYFHDISMVLHPNLDHFSEENPQTDILYTKWKEDFHNLNVDINICDKSIVKRFILRYHQEVNNYFETDIRNNHHKSSSNFIRNQNDLSFIDDIVKKFVADISEGHNYKLKDIYGLKSRANKDLISEKYLMIIIRLADLLDMSKERVSINVLRQNIKHMSSISKYHWISHMAIDKCNMETEYNNNDNKIIENVIISIFFNTRQLTSLTTTTRCENIFCDISNIYSDSPFLELIVHSFPIKREKCPSCNFMCKWIVNKQDYLFKELVELQKYLERNSNTIFNTRFKVLLKFEDTNSLPSDYLDIIKNNIIKSDNTN